MKLKYRCIWGGRKGSVKVITAKCRGVAEGEEVKTAAAAFMRLKFKVGGLNLVIWVIP